MKEIPPKTPFLYHLESNNLQVCSTLIAFYYNYLLRYWSCLMNPAWKETLMNLYICSSCIPARVCNREGTCSSFQSTYRYLLSIRCDSSIALNPWDTVRTAVFAFQLRVRSDKSQKIFKKQIQRSPDMQEINCTRDGQIVTLDRVVGAIS